MPIYRQLTGEYAGLLHREILWGAWAELGLSGWARSHREWAIDPEPIIIATALVAGEDARLRDEALDWCTHNWRQVSRVRLRNLVNVEADDVVDAFGSFAATVNAHVGAAWPLATRARAFTTTGRSAPPALARPSMVWLRMRAMFGVGARTEILRHFLSTPARRISVASIAASINYTKRNVADECTSLERAGLLKVHPIANRLYYSLERSAALRSFVGAFPDVLPDWPALLRVTRSMSGLASRADRTKPAALNVEAYRAMSTIEADLDRVGLQAPPRQDDYWSAVKRFSLAAMTDWAKGRLPANQ